MNQALKICDYLEPSITVNSTHPLIKACADSVLSPGASEIEKAQVLYYWVRDAIRYNPYGLALEPESLSASATLKSGEGWCVAKAILLAALCRYAGIPARLGFADVRNHMSTERMRSAMETDIFYFHGYTSLFINGRWVKATPAFNIELCRKFGLKPLEFNGRDDSLYHEYDEAGNMHMEYLHDRGEYLDVPFEEMLTVFRTHYPAMKPSTAEELSVLQSSEQWEADVAYELNNK